jgi:hypothetical protein
MNHDVYRVVVTTTVPVFEPSGRVGWVTAPEFDPVLCVELVADPAEAGPILRAVSYCVGPVLDAAGRPGYRLSARGYTSGIVVGLHEYQRPMKFAPYVRVFEWAATWDDIPAHLRRPAVYTPA